MNIIQKVNRTRYTLKEILDEEWDTSTIADLSDQEIEKIYSVPSAKNKSLSTFGVASGCNFSLKNKYVPTHELHVIYYNFPELNSPNLKVTKQCGDKMLSLYTSEIINPEDSIILILTDKITENINFKGQNITAFDGIAYPEKFFQSLRDQGGKIVSHITYPDHYIYTENDLLTLAETANKTKSILVSTQKDNVRIPKAYRSLVNTLEGEIVFENEDLLIQILTNVIENYF